MSSIPAAGALSRRALRERLLEQRTRFGAGPDAVEAAPALTRELCAVLVRLEPRCLGLYWPHRAEFNAPAVIGADSRLATVALALPFARKAPPDMHYRLWDGATPALRDEMGMAATDGANVVPDVVLVPCVGFTDSGHRLGYGGGNFDRWLAQHPGACAVGVAWSMARIEMAELAPMDHDVPLTVIVTERGPI